MQGAPNLSGVRYDPAAHAAGLSGVGGVRGRQGAPVATGGRCVDGEPGSPQRAACGPAEPLDTLETKRSRPERAEVGALDRIREGRRSTYATAAHLSSRGPKDPVLQKAAGRLRNCSVHGLFRSHHDGVNYPIGRALCRCRVCPNCQEALSAKRKANAEAFFAQNAEALRPFHFYHLVLTVRHSAAEDVRNNLYTRDVVQHFAALRGQGGTANRAMKDWWNGRVAGGMYSVELTPGRDGSPHIHIHALLLARRPLWRSDGKPSAFIEEARRRWQGITGDSTGVYIEPVYTLTEAGEKKYYSPKTSSTSDLRRAVAECAKYTLKAEPAALEAFSTDFVRDLLTTRARYFGRFGVLTKKANGGLFQGLDRLNTNFRDLEAVEERTAETLVDPETGEAVPLGETCLLVAPFAAVAERTASPSPDGKPCRYYVLTDPAAAVRFGPDLTPDVQVFLAQTLRRRYDPRNDIGKNDIKAATIWRGTESDEGTGALLESNPVA